MLLNKAVVLAANNWKVMLKALLCQIIILALVASLCFLLFGGLVEDIVGILSEVPIGEFVEKTINSIIGGSFDVNDFASSLQNILSTLQQAIENIPNIWNRVEVSYVVCILLVLVYRMLISFSDVAVGFQIHEFMTSNASRPFSWFLVKKFGEGCKFVCLQMILMLPLDIMIVIGGIGLCLILAPLMRWWSIIPSAVLAVILYTARHTAFAFWLPSMANEDLGVSKSLTRAVSAIPYRFWHVFWKTFLLVIVMLGISTLSVLYVDIPVLKLILGTVPSLVLFFLQKCINFVEYFEACNKPYFFKKVDVEGTDRFNKKMQRKNRAAKNRS